MSECQCAAEDIHQNTGHDLPDDESFMEAHISHIDGDAYHWPHSEHLRHTLPGKNRLIRNVELTLRSTDSCDYDILYQETILSHFTDFY